MVSRRNERCGCNSPLNIQEYKDTIDMRGLKFVFVWSEKVNREKK